MGARLGRGPSVSADRQTVQKFGGAALADGPSIETAIELVRARGGERPIVVVSALAGVTRTLEQLVERAAARRPLAEPLLQPIRVRHRTVLRELDLDGELADRTLYELARVLEAVRERGVAGPREHDFVLAAGERLSARIVASALRSAGVPATAIDAFDLGLLADARHGGADLGSLDSLARVLGTTPGVPVVTGFVAAGAGGHVTTLGPNGTDLTATLCARAVGAREVQLWKLVPGLLTADPALVPGARRIAELGFDRAHDFARLGASVLHPSTIEPLVGTDVVLHLLNARAPDEPGTVLANRPSPSGPIGLVSAWGRRASGAFVHDPSGELARLALIGGRREDPSAPLVALGIVPEAVDDGDGWRAVIVRRTELPPAVRALHRAFFEGESDRTMG